MKPSIEGMVRRELGRSGTHGSWQVAASGEWVKLRRRAFSLPEQGWKLHVSAGILSAPVILGRVIEVLREEHLAFKVVASFERLAALNEGRDGNSQVGKFITVYPRDDAQAVRLACSLHQATPGLGGPRIPSDRRLRPGSLVHYRYGGFGALEVRTPLGETLPALRTPDGTLVPDRRESCATTPAWAPDPFMAAGVAADDAREDTRPIGDRFVVLATISESPRSLVHLGLDLQSAARCVLKRVTEDGSGSIERLRHEYEVMRRLGHLSGVPTPHALIGASEHLYLVMDDIPGPTLDQRLAGMRQKNLLPTIGELTRWSHELNRLLSLVHAEGIVYNDLKASNVVDSPGLGLCLVDFELAEDTHDSARSGRCGTVGYMSPNQAAGLPATVADDDFAFGALMYAAATGAEPSQAPFPEDLLGRPLTMLNPRLPSDVVSAIEGCLHPDPERRLSAAVASARISLADASPSEEPRSSALTGPAALAKALRIGDELAAALAGGEPGGHHIRESIGTTTLDLNTGVAGAVLALAEVAHHSGDASHLSALSAGAAWLSRASGQGSGRLPGLYVGDAGIGVALLRAGQVLGDPQLLGDAAEIGRADTDFPLASPDLFNGVAGRLRFLLRLWTQVGDERLLSRARELANHLLSTSTGRSGECGWRIPPGYGSLSGQVQTGYAHGAAGIGDALLDAFEVTGDIEYLDSARGAARWLQRLAVTSWLDGRGINWPPEEDLHPTMAFWCHGAGGIVRFLLHLGRHAPTHELDELVRGAGRVVAVGTRWAGPTQCHGLAGSVECLIDLYQSTDDAAYLSHSGEIAGLLAAFVRESGERVTIVIDRRPANLGFSTGVAGIVACLIRLAQPDTAPHLLSLRGSQPARHWKSRK